MRKQRLLYNGRPLLLFVFSKRIHAHEMTLAEKDYADGTDSELLVRIKAKDWDSVRRATIFHSQNAAETTANELLRIPDKYSNLPLHVALGYQAPDDIILAMISQYPEACKVHGTDDWTPLHVAAMWGASIVVVEALIRAYPQALDDRGEDGIKGRTPRHFSARFPHNQALLERSTESWVEECSRRGAAGDANNKKNQEEESP